MRILNEINKISNKIMGPNGYYIVQGDGRPPHQQGGSYGAPGAGSYAPPHAPQHSYTYPPPNGYGAPPPGAYGTASPMPPTPVHPAPMSPPAASQYGAAPQHPPGPHAGSPQFQLQPQPQPQGSWPPPQAPASGVPPAGPSYGPQPAQGSPQMFTSPPQQFTSPPQQYSSGPPTSPPQVFTSPPQQFTTLPVTSPPLPPTVHPQAAAQPHRYSTAPLPATTAPYPFGPPSATPQLSPSISSHASSPQTPQLHTPHAPTQPPAYEAPGKAPLPPPEDWVSSLHAMLPATLHAASEYVDGATFGIDTFWLYFVDLGGGIYFADAAYGIDGQAFRKDDLGFAGVTSTPEKAHALYKVLAGEWVTKICMRSKVEDVHPARVVVRFDVASQGFISTVCYEVSGVKHPSLTPALVFKEWVARLKATGDDSAQFVAGKSG